MKKPILGWIAVVFAGLALVGLVLSLIAGYIPIFDLPMLCFERIFPFMLSLISLFLGLIGLRGSNRRPALAGIVLSGFVLIFFLAVPVLPAGQSEDRVAEFTPQPGGIDMAAIACQASWYYPSYMMEASGNNLLCGSKLFRANGLVLPLPSVVLSNGETAGPVIWIEKAGDKEFLGGKYPVFEVQPGDHFTARLGCAQDQPQCNAEVSVHVSYESGLTTQKGTDALVSYDQPPVDIDLDLSSLAGERVYLSLHIYPFNQDGSTCQVTIIAPRISAHP